MAENGKSGCLSWIIILFVIGLIGNGIDKCASSSSNDEGMTREEKKEHKIAWNAYEQIMSYCFDNATSKDYGSQTGYVSGSARFNYDFSAKTIKVTYSALQYQTTEIGNLSKFTVESSCGLKNADNYYPVSIQGRWQPEGSGGGDLIIALSKDNTLHVFIFGDGDWKHWAEYSLPSSSQVLNLLNDALSEANIIK